MHSALGRPVASTPLVLWSLAGEAICQEVGSLNWHACMRTTRKKFTPRHELLQTGGEVRATGLPSRPAILSGENQFEAHRPLYILSPTTSQNKVRELSPNHLPAVVWGRCSLGGPLQERTCSLAKRGGVGAQGCGGRGGAKTKC